MAYSNETDRLNAPPKHRSYPAEAVSSGKRSLILYATSVRFVAFSFRIVLPIWTFTVLSRDVVEPVEVGRRVSRNPPSGQHVAG